MPDQSTAKTSMVTTVGFIVCFYTFIISLFHILYLCDSFAICPWIVACLHEQIFLQFKVNVNILKLSISFTTNRFLSSLPGCQKKKLSISHTSWQCHTILVGAKNSGCFSRYVSVPLPGSPFFEAKVEIRLPPGYEDTDKIAFPTLFEV